MSGERHRVVIAGGGVAALEAFLALRALAGHIVELTLISPAREFVERPVTVAEPFGRAEARVYALRQLLADAGGGELIWDAVQSVDAEEQRVLTSSDEYVGYDTLIVAMGARAQEPLPGALTFRGRGDVPALRDLIGELVRRKAGVVALTLPSERVWSLPIYELAVLTAGHLREAGAETEVRLVTPEKEPLQVFGPAAARAIKPMLREQGIGLRTSSRPELFRDGALVLTGGGRVHADRVITLPRLVGPAIPGLPQDSQGFIPVDGHGRVIGLESVYAAGDVTSFPLKQGGLAAQQADAVAESIAAGLGVPLTAQPFRPVLRGLLMTGGVPLYLRAQPDFPPQTATPVIEGTRSTMAAHGGASIASGQPLWWPPAKLAGRYLAPFLATARPQPLDTGLLVDRAPAMASPAAEQEEALTLSLLLADCDARWGDYPAALHALDAARALAGALPPEYEAKRREWSLAAKAA